MPSFTFTQEKLIKGAYDFLGLNHYTSKYIKNTVHRAVHPQGWHDDSGCISSDKNREGKLIGPVADSFWLHVVPHGLYKCIDWIMRRYDSPVVYVTENGVDVPNEAKLSFAEILKDEFRIDYFRQYLNALKQAIDEGANVKGYFAWSLLDNFEWADGYDKRFGLHYVNFSDPGRERIPKDSAKWYTNYIKTHA